MFEKQNFERSFSFHLQIYRNTSLIYLRQYVPNQIRIQCTEIKIKFGIQAFDAKFISNHFPNEQRRQRSRKLNAVNCQLRTSNGNQRMVTFNDFDICTVRYSSSVFTFIRYDVWFITVAINSSFLLRHKPNRFPPLLYSSVILCPLQLHRLLLPRARHLH